MTDRELVALYWERDEQAIVETGKKYGGYCHSIAYHILNNHSDAEECVNDTYYSAWNCIPPHKPSLFSAFLGKITRNLSLNRYRASTAQKRGGGVVEITLEELGDCIAAGKSLDEQIEGQALADCIDRFLRILPETERNLFLCRYWYFDSVKELCRQFDLSESAVKTRLLRIRRKLAEYLVKEEFVV
ncbi:MAG: sigma-70 family RNA polymerase sigma factor [Clostridia bacterium]|nr:sigma-70 family RNA polymerase sigma factor [Clostridia bacterium]